MTVFRAATMTDASCSAVSLGGDWWLTDVDSSNLDLLVGLSISFGGALSLSTIYSLSLSLALSIMKQRTWPSRSDGSHFTALQLYHTTTKRTRNGKAESSSSNSSTSEFRFTLTPSKSNHRRGRDFSELPYDVLEKIAANFTVPNLRAASMVCRSWRDALRPLREAMVFLRWGKRFKHGRGGVKRNLNKALDSFLKGAARGSTLAMVDAGLVYWEMGKKEEGISLYRKAAQLGDPSGLCNLGLSYLHDKPTEAVEWLFKASMAGHVRAQYQLALCLHQGRGVDRDLFEAAKWYLKAAEAGYLRAMYNVSLCYSFGEGFVQNRRVARKWMKRAADSGHTKAQFEHGLGLFSEGDMMKAVVYLELAARAGETAAIHVKDAVFQRMSPASRDRAMRLADTWRPLPFSP